jgi:hypothetical protein
MSERAGLESAAWPINPAFSSNPKPPALAGVVQVSSVQVRTETFPACRFMHLKGALSGFYDCNSNQNSASLFIPDTCITSLIDLWIRYVNVENPGKNTILLRTSRIQKTIWHSDCNLIHVYNCSGWRTERGLYETG